MHVFFICLFECLSLSVYHCWYVLLVCIFASVCVSASLPISSEYPFVCLGFFGCFLVCLLFLSVSSFWLSLSLSLSLSSSHSVCLSVSLVILHSTSFSLHNLLPSQTLFGFIHSYLEYILFRLIFANVCVRSLWIFYDFRFIFVSVQCFTFELLMFHHDDSALLIEYKWYLCRS